MKFSKVLQESLVKAYRTARERHAGQNRKFDNKPYFVHPSRVARLVSKYKGTSKNLEQLLKAAVLHDTVEDTDLTLNEIRKDFGNLVASIVNELTSDVHGIKAEGKKEYLADKMANKLSDYALVIKLADRLDNVSDFNIAPESFVKKYKDETNYILDALESKRKLTQTQKNIIKEIRKKLK